MAAQAGRQAEVHRPSHQPGSRDNLCELSTFETSGLILNQTPRSSEPDVLGLAVPPIWGAGWGRSPCAGLSSSCVFLGSFLFPQRLSRLLGAAQHPWAPGEGRPPSPAQAPSRVPSSDQQAPLTQQTMLCFCSLTSPPAQIPVWQASCHYPCVKRYQRSPFGLQTRTLVFSFPLRY